MPNETLKIETSGLITLRSSDRAIGTIPHRVLVTITDPDGTVMVQGRDASIRADGQIRFVVDRSVTKKPGTYLVDWGLTLPVFGVQVPVEDLIADNIGYFSTTFLVFDGDVPPVAPIPLIPTPDEIRDKWCFGLPLQDNDGNLIADDRIQEWINGAVGYIERELQIAIGEKTYSTDPAPGMQRIAPLDYDPDRMANWGFLQLPVTPVNGVSLLEIRFGLDNNGFQVPVEWITLFNEAGQIQLVPGPLGMYSAGAELLFPSFFGGQGSYCRKVPGAVRVTFTAGLTEITQDMRDAICRVAAMSVLNTVSDSTIGGIATQSTSVDGISESVSTTSSPENSTYQSGMNNHKKAIDAWLNVARGMFRGVKMTVA